MGDLVQLVVVRKNNEETNRPAMTSFVNERDTSKQTALLNPVDGCDDCRNTPRGTNAHEDYFSQRRRYNSILHPIRTWAGPLHDYPNIIQQNIAVRLTVYHHA